MTQNRHPMSNTFAYEYWTNFKDKDKFCDAWKNDFSTFYNDIGKFHRVGYELMLEEGASVYSVSTCELVKTVDEPVAIEVPEPKVPEPEVAKPKTPRRKTRKKKEKEVDVPVEAVTTETEIVIKPSS